MRAASGPCHARFSAERRRHDRPAECCVVGDRPTAFGAGQRDGAELPGALLLCRFPLLGGRDCDRSERLDRKMPTSPICRPPSCCGGGSSRLLSSLYSPGFSYLFTWPLMGSLLARLWNCFARSTTTGSWGHVAILLLGGAPGLILVVPAVYSLFQAMGVPSPGFSGSPSFPDHRPLPLLLGAARRTAHSELRTDLRQSQVAAGRRDATGCRRPPCRRSLIPGIASSNSASAIMASLDFSPQSSQGSQSIGRK